MGTQELVLSVGPATHGLINRDISELLASWEAASSDRGGGAMSFNSITSAITDTITEKLAGLSASLPTEITSRLEPLGVSLPPPPPDADLLGLSSSSSSSRRGSRAEELSMSRTNLGLVRGMMERVLLAWCYVHRFDKYCTGRKEGGRGRQMAHTLPH